MMYKSNETELNIEAQFEKPVVGFPNEKSSRGTDYHNEFNIIIKNMDGNRAVFKFYGSTSDYNKNKVSMNDDDLKCALESILGDGLSGLMDFDQFCDEYGYDQDSRSAERIHKACIESMDKLEYLGIEESDMYRIITELNNE